MCMGMRLCQLYDYSLVAGLSGNETQSMCVSNILGTGEI